MKQDWADEARRYYIGIVGKFGAQSQKLLQAAAGLDIQIICPLHGPVLKENLGYYLDLYNKWTTYTPETKGVLIAYTTIYGHTKKAVEILAEDLKQRGVGNVKVTDLARSDLAEAVADAFRYDRLVLATTTYNAGIFPAMRDFIFHLTDRNFQNRKIGIIENGTWAPTAEKVIRGFFEKSKNLTYLENSVHIRSAVNDGTKEQIARMADELAE